MAPADPKILRYQELAERLAELIRQGTYPPGRRIPSVRQMSQQQNLSISTVLQAYSLLERQELIEARPQSGYYVRSRVWHRPEEPEKSSPSVRSTRVNPGDLVKRVLSVARDPAFSRLGAALPDPQLLPTLQLSRAMAAVGRRSPHLANSYDISPGNATLRIQIARRAMEAGCTLSPDDIVTTCGCQEALSLSLRAITRPGDTIAIESPTYFGVLQIISELGLKVCEIPTYPREGVCLDELSERLDACRIKACLFMLNFSNPLGSCMPDRKKALLVEMLAEREIPLIEDDIYGDLAFSLDRPKAAKAFDRKGLVLLCSSFCKTLAPGYRVGWVVPGRYRERIEHLKFVTSIGTSTLPQLAIADFLADGGFDRHLRKLRRIYAEQVDRVTHAIARYFPEGTRVTRPTGGYVLWVELPGQIDSIDLFERAQAEKISIAPGPMFSPGQRFQNFIRVNCGNPWSEQIESALLRLGRIMTDMQAASGRQNGR